MATSCISLNSFMVFKHLKKLYKDLTPDLLFLYLDGMGTNLV